MFDGKKTICMIISRFNDEMTAMLIGFDPFFEGGLIWHINLDLTICT